VELTIPITESGNVIQIDESAIRRAFPRGIQAVGAEIAKSASDWVASI